MIEILHTSRNLEEFKAKYIELEAKHKQIGEDLSQGKRNELTYQASIEYRRVETDKENKNIKIQVSQKELENKTFKPIQGESKNKETYKDEIKQNFFLNFLEAQKEKGADILEILENL